MVYYAVAKGTIPGIYTSWEDCRVMVIKFSNAKYKKFTLLKDARDFIEQYKSNDTKVAVVDYYVYTDGACSNNGKPNAKAGIGIYFGPHDVRNVSESLDINQKQTNNVAELKAIAKTYKIIYNDLKDGKHICVVSDSEYAIKCVTTHGAKCAKKIGQDIFLIKTWSRKCITIMHCM